MGFNLFINKIMKSFFYTDASGNLKKFIFCIRGCPEPYKQNEIGIKIFRANKTTFLCQKCIKTLNIRGEFFLKSFLPIREDNIIDESVVEPEQKITENEFIQFEVQKQIPNFKRPSKYLINETMVLDTTNAKQKNCVFVIQCRDLTYYCGITSNLKKAIRNHNSGCGSPYTKPKERRPVVLVTSKEAFSIEEAKKMKIEFKNLYHIEKN